MIEKKEQKKSQLKEHFSCSDKNNLHQVGVHKLHLTKTMYKYYSNHVDKRLHNPQLQLIFCLRQH